MAVDGGGRAGRSHCCNSNVRAHVGEKHEPKVFYSLMMGEMRAEIIDTGENTHLRSKTIKYFVLKIKALHSHIFVKS